MCTRSAVRVAGAKGWHHQGTTLPKDGAMTKDIKEMDTAVFQPCIAASCWRVWRLMLPQIMYDVLGFLVGPNELATCCSKCADVEDFQVRPFTATCFVGARKAAMLGKNFFQLTLNRQEI